MANDISEILRLLEQHMSPTNLLITGSPRSGKTTVIQRVSNRLTDEGYQADGVYCTEQRVDGERVGFDLVDVVTGDSCTLAHVDRTEGPSVGRYQVNVGNIETMYATAFQRAIENTDFLLVDEIAPMQVYSKEFPRQIRRALDADLPLLAAIHDEETDGFIGEVKQRDDIKIFEVSEETRDELPVTLTELLRGWM
jgi:nucleoside-triphosphatase